MDWYNICLTNYKMKFYNDDSMKIFVDKGKITKEQYKEITGNEYTHNAG